MKFGIWLELWLHEPNDSAKNHACMWDLDSRFSAEFELPTYYASGPNNFFFLGSLRARKLCLDCLKTPKPRPRTFTVDYQYI